MSEATISNAEHEESAASDMQLTKRGPKNASIFGENAGNRSVISCRSRSLAVTALARGAYGEIIASVHGASERWH